MEQNIVPVVFSQSGRQRMGKASLAYCKANQTGSNSESHCERTTKKKKRTQRVSRKATDSLRNSGSTTTTRVTRSQTATPLDNDAADSAAPLDTPNKRKRSFIFGPSSFTVKSEQATSSSSRHTRTPSADAESKRSSSGSSSTTESSSRASSPSSSDSSFVTSKPLQLRKTQLATTSGKALERIDGFFVCQEPGCTYRISKASSMKDHLRSHLDDKPHKCEAKDCGRSFKLIQMLRRHVREVHTPRRVYKCQFSECDRTSVRKTNMTAHELKCQFRPGFSGPRRRYMKLPRLQARRAAPRIVNEDDD